jgi:hypothetical protein
MGRPAPAENMDAAMFQFSADLAIAPPCSYQNSIRQPRVILRLA